MQTGSKYTFSLPPEEEVIKRNRTITTYYAQLYRANPPLYKWAGMAAFASFHIGRRLRLWDWDASGIMSFSETCEKKSRSLEDDFQIVRIINNKIFAEIGWVHLAFSQMDFESFMSLMVEKKRHAITIGAFEKLHKARTQIQTRGASLATDELVWEANTEILWHEQSMVVQPLFDRLSELFSNAMTFFAGFDYSINHGTTSWKYRSRFILFMIFKGFSLLKKNRFKPDVTHLEHRWHWITIDLISKWQKAEKGHRLLSPEIAYLAQLEQRNLIL